MVAFELGFGVVHRDPMSGENTLRVEDGVGGEGFVTVPVSMLGRLTPNALALWVALLRHGWKNGRAWPGMETLAAETQVGERGLRVAKAELIEVGLLVEKRRGRGLTNLYRVFLHLGGSRSGEKAVLEPAKRRHEVDVGEVDDSLRSSHVSDSDSDSDLDLDSDLDEPSSTTSQQQGEDGNPRVRETEPPLRNGGVSAALRFPCPRCGMPVAERCEGKRAERESCHKERHIRARRGGTVTQGERAAGELTRQLAALMRANDEKAKTGERTKGWNDAMRLLVDTDGRDPDEVETVLAWCQADHFWKTNILSAPKFREKYAQLRARWDAERHPAGSPRNASKTIEQTRAEMSSLADFINRPAGTSRADLNRRTGAH